MSTELYYRIIKIKGKPHVTMSNCTVDDHGDVWAEDGAFGNLNDRSFLRPVKTFEEAAVLMNKALAAAVYYHATKAAKFSKWLKELSEGENKWGEAR